MSNAIYDVARLKFATAAIDWRIADLWVCVFSGPLDFVAADASLNAIVARGNVLPQGNSLPITAKNVAPNGSLQTNAVVIPGITDGVVVTQLVLALGVPPDAASVPLLFVDDAENLPFTGNGLDVVVQPDWAMEQGWARL